VRQHPLLLPIAAEQSASRNEMVWGSIGTPAARLSAKARDGSDLLRRAA
jgi:hypothetical protein